MILTPHAIIGVALARLATNNPIIGFGVGFLSHFIADMVPHWEYKVSESIHPDISSRITLNKEFFKDLLKIGSDILVGLTISFWLFYDRDLYFILASGIGGIFPDFLQFLYGKIKIKPLILFKRLHDSMHADKSGDKIFSGIFSQVFVTLFFILMSYWLLPL